MTSEEERKKVRMIEKYQAMIDFKIPNYSM